MKKFNSKLLLAAAGLGLAVASTVGSTYAWFSSSGSATATGAKVKIQADDSLVISKTDVEANYTKSIALDGSLTAPAPCALKTAKTYSGENPFYKLTASGMAKVNLNGGYTGTAYGASGYATGDFTNAVQGTDYIYESFYIKSTSAMTVTASVTLTSMTKNISDAIHFTLIAGGTTIGEKEVTSLSTLSYDFGDISLAATTSKKIEVYVWYDGNDSACTNNNALTPETIELTFNFSKKAEG